MKFTRLAVLGSAVAGAALLAMPAAQASVTTTTDTPNVAGFQVNGNGLRAYNDVRATFTVDSGSLSDPAVILQSLTSGGDGNTAELALITTDTCGADARQLEYAYGPSSSLTFLSITPSVCVPDGTRYYLEIHYSTWLNQVSFLGGTEQNSNVLKQIQLSPGDFQEFHAPAIVASYNLPAPTAFPSATAEQVHWTRAGLTSLDHATWRRGGTNARITFASQNLVKYVATTDGASDGTVFLEPAGGWGAGSSRSITTEAVAS